MAGLGVAFSFLTRIPVGVRVESGADLGRSVAWFPVVGAVVGLGVGAVSVLLAAVMPHLVAALLAVGAGMMLTGAFHEDGLADTFDGLAGGYTPQRRLEIMKDSRLGTFGAAALFVALGSKAGLLAALLDHPWWRVMTIMAAAGAVSRAVSVWWMPRVAAASPGLGSDYLDAVTTRGVLTAGLVGLAAGATLGPGGMVALAIAFAAGAGPVWWARRAIGGITGDILGATQVVAEIAFLAVVGGAGSWW
jgi:adenosylcobinamide-GDP ribazoletransferase